jgi:hypothetical protein
VTFINTLLNTAAVFGILIVGLGGALLLCEWMDKHAK